jgi:hypothetical protein
MKQRKRKEPARERSEAENSEMKKPDMISGFFFQLRKSPLFLDASNVKQKGIKS